MKSQFFTSAFLSKSVLYILLSVSMLSASTLHADNFRIRGILKTVNDSAISIQRASGKVVEVTMSKPYSVLLYKDITLVDIPEQAYLSIPSVAAGNNKVRALGVNVFPKSMQGFHEGSVDWDLGANSKVTNATLDKIVSEGGIQELVVRFGNTRQMVQVPVKTPITAFDIAPSYQLKTGQRVVVHVDVVGNKQTGTLVHVRENGEFPPI